MLNLGARRPSEELEWVHAAEGAELLRALLLILIVTFHVLGTRLGFRSDRNVYDSGRDSCGQVFHCLIQ